MPIPDTSAAKPDLRTPDADGLNNERRDALRNDEREAPKAPVMSGGSKPEANALGAPPDLRDAGEPQEPLGVDDARSGP